MLYTALTRNAIVQRVQYTMSQLAKLGTVHHAYIFGSPGKFNLTSGLTGYNNLVDELGIIKLTRAYDWSGLGNHMSFTSTHYPTWTKNGAVFAGNEWSTSYADLTAKGSEYIALNGYTNTATSNLVGVYMDRASSPFTFGFGAFSGLFPNETFTFIRASSNAVYTTQALTTNRHRIGFHSSTTDDMLVIDGVAATISTAGVRPTVGVQRIRLGADATETNKYTGTASAMIGFNTFLTSAQYIELDTLINDLLIFLEQVQ